MEDPMPSRVFMPEYIRARSMEADRAPIAREGEREALRASVLTSVAMSEGRPRLSRDTLEAERAPVAPDGSRMPWVYDDTSSEAVLLVSRSCELTRPRRPSRSSSSGCTAGAICESPCFSCKFASSSRQLPLTIFYPEYSLT